MSKFTAVWKKEDRDVTKELSQSEICSLALTAESIGVNQDTFELILNLTNEEVHVTAFDRTIHGQYNLETTKTSEELLNKYPEIFHLIDMVEPQPVLLKSDVDEDFVAFDERGDTKTLNTCRSCGKELTEKQTDNDQHLCYEHYIDEMRDKVNNGEKWLAKEAKNQLIEEDTYACACCGRYVLNKWASDNNHICREGYILRSMKQKITNYDKQQKASTAFEQAMLGDF